jgi:hypothetical protein
MTTRRISWVRCWKATRLTLHRIRRQRVSLLNYYLADVRFRLAEFKEDNADFEVDQRLLKKGQLNQMLPADRWRAYQKAFKDAVKHFEDRLNAIAA